MLVFNSPVAALQGPSDIVLFSLHSRQSSWFNPLRSSSCHWTVAVTASHTRSVKKKRFEKKRLEKCVSKSFLCQNFLAKISLTITLEIYTHQQDCLLNCLPANHRALTLIRLGFILLIPYSRNTDEPWVRHRTGDSHCSRYLQRLNQTSMLQSSETSAEPF